MRAVVRRASERELVVLLAEDTGDEATEQAYERLVAQARIDGLIVTSANDHSSLPARVIASGAPCVFAGRGVRGQRSQRAARRGAGLDRSPSSTSPRSGTRGSATSPGPVDASDIIERRVTGFLGGGRKPRRERADRARLARRGRRRGGDRAPARGRSAPDRHLRDELQSGLRRACRDPRLRALAIPRDVSVIAATTTRSSTTSSPPQTAMRRDHDELGTAAVDALLEQMAGSPRARRRAELGAGADRAGLDGATADATAPAAEPERWPGTASTSSSARRGCTTAPARSPACPAHLAELGLERVVLGVRPGPARRRGPSTAVREIAVAAGVDVQLYTDTAENPTTANLEEIAALYRAQGCDGIVGLGGGSSLDAAKAASALIENGGSVVGLPRTRPRAPPRAARDLHPDDLRYGRRGHLRRRDHRSGRALQGRLRLAQPGRRPSRSSIPSSC